jgi:hypothetical protein
MLDRTVCVLKPLGGATRTGFFVLKKLFQLLHHLEDRLDHYGALANAACQRHQLQQQQQQQLQQQQQQLQQQQQQREEGWNITNRSDLACQYRYSL